MEKIKSRKKSLGKENEKDPVDRDEKRVAMRCFSREILIYPARKSRFVKRDNLHAWRELFTNVCKRKSRI